MKFVRKWPFLSTKGTQDWAVTHLTNFNKTYLENETLVWLQNRVNSKHIFKSH